MKVTEEPFEQASQESIADQVEHAAKSFAVCYREWCAVSQDVAKAELNLSTLQSRRKDLQYRGEAAQKALLELVRGKS